AAERGLGEDERKERDGGHEVLAVPAPGEHDDRDDHDADHAREGPVGVLDDRVEVHPRHHVAVAERPAVEARAGRAAAEPRVRDPHHSAHDDEDEGGDRGREYEPAHQRLRGATGCATVSAGTAPAAISRRMSFIGSTLRMRGTTSKLLGGGGEVVNHSSVLPCHGSLPATRPFFMLTSAFTSVTRMPMARMNAPIVEIRL